MPPPGAVSGRVPGPLGIAVLGDVLRAQVGGGVKPIVPGGILIEPEPLARSRAVLRNVSFPLFHSGKKPKPEDVVQGELANCPLAALLVAMAQATPDAITNMISEFPAQVVSARWSDKDNPQAFLRTNRLFLVRFRNHPEWVTAPLYVYDPSDRAYASSPNSTGWMSYIEKGYATWKGNRSYNNLNDRSSGPDANTVMEDLVGPPDVADLVNKKLFKAGQETPLTDPLLTDMLNKGSRFPTIAGTLDTNIPVKDIVAHHMYAVLGFAQGQVQLRNPWNDPSKTFGQNFSLSVADFKKSFVGVLQSPPSP
jgi:Calpain family cysteine protease